MSINNNSSVIFDSLGNWIRQLGLEEQLNSQQIESGRLVGQIMRKIVQGYNLQLMNSNSAVNRVSNWNNLINELRNINIRVSQDDKTKIINGNKDIVYQIIHKLKEYHQNNQKQNQVDISKIDPQATIADSSSLLQLLILSIMKYFGLSSKQSVALLSNQSRYLAHILAKGFKGEFKPIINLLKELLMQIDSIHQFCSRNKQNEQFLIRAIKPSLISKSDDVAILGLNLIDKYIQRAHSDRSHSSHKFQILKQYLLSTLLLGIKRHQHLSPTILNFIIKISQSSDSLLLIIKNEMLSGNHSIQKEHDYQTVVVSLIQIMKQQIPDLNFLQLKGAKDALSRAINNSKNSNLALSSMNLIIQMTKQTPQIILQVPQSSSFVDNMQQALLSLSKQSQQQSFINQLFSLLSILGGAKIQYAPGIYKILNTKYAQTANRSLLDSFTDNFNQIIREFPSIPFSLIINTLNSKLESNMLNLTQKQIQFFQNLVEMDYETDQHLDEKSFLIIYNCVSKFFLEEVAYSQICGQLIIQILKRFGQSIKIFNDLTNKFVKVCLAVHFANVKKLYMNSYKYRKSVNGSMQSLDPQDVHMKVKNLAIQSFLYRLVKEQISNINASIQPLISYSLIQIQNMAKQYGVGLRKIIQYFGNPSEIIQKYETQAKKLDQETLKKQDSKKSKIKQNQQWGSPNPSRYQKSPNQSHHKGATSHLNNSDQMLTKKALTGRYTNFQSQLGVTPAAQRGLDKYHKVYLSKIQKVEKQETKKKDEQQRQSYLKKVFERKMLDKGIEVKKFKDEEYQYIWQFGQKQKQIKSDAVKGRLNLLYYQVQNEEERDIKGLQYTMKKYGKVLKLYYTQYSGHHRPKNLQSFDQIAEKYNLLYSSSIVRMFKQHTLDEFISVHQIQYLCKKININLGKKMDDPTSLDYQGFEQFIIQTSFTMFTRPPKDMRGHPISEMIQETLSRFRMYAGENRLNEKIFEDPQNVYVNETQAIRELNRKLADNSEYILPEGYKKIVEKKVFFTHRIFLDAMSASYKDVYEVIDDILHKAISAHIVEPFTTYQTYAKARPSLYYNQRNDADVHSEKMSVFMKKQVLKIPIKDRQIAKQSALILEDIVDAVQLGHSRIGMKHENHYVKSKKKQIQSQLKKQEEQKKKWQDRSRHIKSALTKHKQVQKQKVNEQKQRKKEEKRRQQEKQKKRKDEEDRLKKRVEQYQQKKRQDEERRRKQAKQRRKKQKIEAEKKKKEYQETKKKIQQIKQQKQQQQLQRKKQEEAERKRKKQIEKKKFQQDQRRKKQMIEEYKNTKSGLHSSKADQQAQN